MKDRPSKRLLPWKIPDTLVRRWYITVPVIIAAAGVLVPLFYLGVRAFQADPRTLMDLVFRTRNAVLLGKTLALAIGVVVTTSLIALPMAWMTVRVRLPGRMILTVLGVLPLAVPGYVMAYVLLSTTGESGTLARTFGVALSRLDGFDGALIALSLTTYPYMFLNLRTALLGMDPGLEESARTLGAGKIEVFFRVILPQLRPAFLAGGLLVGLHVLGDFGVVSLMRYETFSYALYLQYTASYDRIYAAWLGLILLAITFCALFLESYFLKGVVYNNDREQSVDDIHLLSIGNWKYPGYAFAGAIGFVSVVLPVITVSYWMIDPSFGQESGWALTETLLNSVSVSLPSAGLAALLALPLAYVGVRYDTLWSQGIERIAYLGYATPRLAFALAWIVFVLAVIPSIYQTLLLLVLAYTLHFLAESIGPIRSAFYQTPLNLEEAARSLGSGPIGRFFRIIFPLVRRGVLVSIAFVFLSAMKELPLTLLLGPPGFETLATQTWQYAEENMFARAAPHALTIILFSACFVGLLLQRD